MSAAWKLSVEERPSKVDGQGWVTSMMAVANKVHARGDAEFLNVGEPQSQRRRPPAELLRLRRLKGHFSIDAVARVLPRSKTESLRMLGALHESKNCIHSLRVEAAACYWALQVCKMVREFTFEWERKLGQVRYSHDILLRSEGNKGFPMGKSNILW